MRAVHRELIAGGLATSVVVGLLALTVGLGPGGWLVGLAAGWAWTGLVGVGRLRRGGGAILPADRVTLSRAILAAGAAALVAGPGPGSHPVTALVALAAAALVLDGVDGRVARHTRTVTPFGARLDGEVDAFLILVLSVEVSRSYGTWVLLIGAARYALLVAGWALPWLAAPLPPRYWRKVVAAVQGVVLTVATSAALPRWMGVAAVVIALALLVESFGRDVVWLYRTGAGERTRRAVRGATTGTAICVVWAALVAPDRLDRLTPAAFARIPLEAVVVAAIGLALPHRPRRAVAVLAGVAFGVLTVLKILDMAFYQELGRPFDPVLDWGNLGPAVGVVRDSIGTAATVAAVVLVVLGLAGTIGLVTASTIRVVAVAARHRRRSAGGVAAVGVVWALSAALGLQLAPGTSVTSTSAADVAVSQVRDATAALRDQRSFERAISAADPYAQIPAQDLVTRLRGKDVVVAFVESYGQVAVQGTPFSRGVDAVLRAGTATLARAGFSARSAFLTSPTFGGISWLAHSTLQSGLWVANQQRYDQLTGSHRLTLSGAFHQAGWRTVSDIPSDEWAWPAGRSFYHYDQLYDRRNVGYRGPTFSYAAVPDQYTLAAFQRLELAPGHRPLMAEIDLVSSHTPWTPLPRMVPWDRLGDGSIFDPMPAQGLTPAVAWRDSATVRGLYGESIQYSLQALVSWVARLHDDNLVLILLGDHQPNTTVSGAGANHEVPISFVAHDKHVLDRIASWHWQDGLLPARGAPLWPMDAFRNRFFDAFGAGTVPPTRPRPAR